MQTKSSLALISLFPLSALAQDCLVDPVVNPSASSQYGKIREGYGGSVHQGHDVVSRGANASKNLSSSSSGKVIYAGFRGGAYGNMIAIQRESGDVVLYKHVKNAYHVKVGDSVKPGQRIGYYSGTKNSATDDGGYAHHLHFEYVVDKPRAQQYSYHPHTKTVSNRFTNLGGKQLTDRVVNSLVGTKYYTDPSPYLCNDWPTDQNTGHYRFKTVKEQYNFIKNKLGMAGFEVGGVPNNVASGGEPGLAEYSVALGCTELEQAYLNSSSSTAAAAPPASASTPSTTTSSTN